jgi:hypothetical protein
MVPVIVATVITPPMTTVVIGIVAAVVIRPEAAIKARAVVVITAVVIRRVVTTVIIRCWRGVHRRTVIAGLYIVVTGRKTQTKQRTEQDSTIHGGLLDRRQHIPATLVGVSRTLNG